MNVYSNIKIIVSLEGTIERILIVLEEKKSWSPAIGWHKQQQNKWENQGFISFLEGVGRREASTIKA